MSDAELRIMALEAAILCALARDQASGVLVLADDVYRFLKGERERARGAGERPPRPN